jgi:catechol 2,3-dioxygenase-like lactoylglutathione lyase family enzyme
MVDFKLEAIVLPVSDVDRAKAFYENQCGFVCDIDHQPNESFRVVQFTPPGSQCSITFGIGMSTKEPGSYEGFHLVVTDIEAARAELVGRGLDISEPFHFGPDGKTPGLDPSRGDFGTYCSFSDPDGNGWLLQEVPSRASGV